MAGVDVLHVPDKGSGPAMVDLTGGQVQAMIETAPSAQPHIKIGKIRALATTTLQAVKTLPGVPTATQAGLRGFEVTSMFGVSAPAGTPQAIVARISAEVKESLLSQGAVATYTSPEEASKAINTQYQKWVKVNKDGNIKPE